MTEPEAIWQPTPDVVAEANLTRFIRACGQPDYRSLLDWSVAEPEAFYRALLDHIGYRFFKPFSRAYDIGQGPEWPRWCVDGETNIALNCLDKWQGTATWEKPALEWIGEDGSELTWTYADLDVEVRRLAAGLRRLGIGPGDVVAIYLPNLPEAAVALLAVPKIGGIVLPLFSGFGEDAVAARLIDAEAKAIITVDGSYRRGRVVAAKPVVDAIRPRVPSLEHVIVCHRVAVESAWTDGVDHRWADVTASQSGDDDSTASVAADSPYLLIYTSGTTGKPKGVVHTHCSFPPKLVLDLGICMDFKPADRILWMSDMGWLVGPLLVYGATLMGGTIILPEGTPDYPVADRLWRIAAEKRVSYLGVAPTMARSFMADPGFDASRYDLSALRIFVSTGEAWTPEAWRWLFETIGGGRLPIVNFSGGTEMCGILSSVVTEPIKACSFTAPVPGTAAAVFDEAGREAGPGEVGELVMRRAPIGLTQGLWRDRERYLDGYWSTWPGVWHHGDFARRDADGFYYILGRSDDTLKIAGKRTGPSEIEALLLETHLVREAAAIGVPDPIKGTAIVCACVLREGVNDRAAAEALVAAVVKGLGTPFRPKDVLFCPDLPKTRNMKIMRRVIRAAYLGLDPGDLSSLVNPEAIESIKRKTA
ncbi:MAG: AMP-binding protein [Alphaproteobacteria bacterium]|nr:AMP-binding protein [Alphaproteobacteria bacterium]MCB9929900.1 AMP-binding protein [Alphaproteobacteria bacterium]